MASYRTSRRSYYGSGYRSPIISYPSYRYPSRSRIITPRYYTRPIHPTRPFNNRPYENPSRHRIPPTRSRPQGHRR